MSGWFAEVAARLAGDPVLQALLAALATLVLEDPTTITCGLLVADGRMGFMTAFAGVAGGIMLGDAGLYGAGRLLGPRVLAWGWISPERFRVASDWFRRNLVAAVGVSRFVPGMRLPTYLAAGILRAPVGRFLAVVIVASAVWAFALLRITLAIGEAVLPALGRWRWPVAVAALVALVIAHRATARRVARKSADPNVRVASVFEFWPPWLFYVPVAVAVLCLAIRHRGLMLPSVANPSIPSGGLIHESKSQILNLVPEPHRRWLAPYIVYRRPDAGTPPEQIAAAAGKAIRNAGLDYPLVAKPDRGQRGAGVQPIRDDGDLRRYLERFPPGADVLLQRMVGEGERAEAIARDPGVPLRLRGVREAGVLYWRMPGSERGEIFSITFKKFPEVVGDGRRTLRELILADPRARRIRSVYFRRHRERLDEVPDEGEARRLVFSGNHCQGAVFRNGTDLATPRLLRRLDEIARGMPEFYFGRFDARFDDPRAFLEGEDLRIVEINGAGAEATHIWDPATRLADAYRTLFRQFSILYRIGAANRARGHRPTGALAFLRDALAYRKLSRAYPPAR